jgi:hypothetical protein
MDQHMTHVPAAETFVPAKLVLDDDATPPERPQRLTLNLWVKPPAGLTKAAEEAVVRSAAIVFLERALDSLRNAPAQS